MCADLTRNSGGMAVFNGADYLEKGLSTICTSGCKLSRLSTEQYYVNVKFYRTECLGQSVRV
jgi:hypothetical protein